jgi:hypothetical protein
MHSGCREHAGALHACWHTFWGLFGLAGPKLCTFASPTLASTLCHNSCCLGMLSCRGDVVE